jgi:hypothetical protein
MVGPWLFWLAPMIFVSFAAFFGMALLLFLFFFFPLLVSDGIAMTCPDDHLWRSGDGSGHLGKESREGRFRYLGGSVPGHDYEMIRCFLLCVASRWTPFMLSAPM